MDRAHPRRPADRHRIPRTRGDGPAGRDWRWRLRVDSPHARGWTGAPAAAGRQDEGFPARAGMDRGRSPPRRQQPGIPRTRGDGPLARAQAAVRTSDSPHARGWTPVRTPRGVRDSGFPARAGMDPSAPTSRTGTSGIPRTRGDGPASTRPVVHHAADSPHARGWTREESPRPLARPGFPARAGGDGPAPVISSTGAQTDSPHARGWTLADQVGLQRRAGFPARAGMDPRAAAGSPVGAWIPRTRGDGPSLVPPRYLRPPDSPHARGWTSADSRRARVAVGFPARAGMDPLRLRSAPAGRWIPRTRGDGPAERGMSSMDDLDSPHARGWTVRAGARLERPRGFPARAGMDPSARASTCSRTGIPRTRGDGPRWTGRRHRPGPGFPARAGMDLSTA